MTFGVYIGGFQVIFGSKRGFFDQFCGHFMSFLWVEGLCRGIGVKNHVFGPIGACSGPMTFILGQDEIST